MPNNDVDYSQLMYSDPKAYTERVKQELREEYAAERQQQGQQQALAEFGRQLIAENPDLADKQDIINGVFSKNLNTLADLPMDEARAKLAELTRERIAQLGGGLDRPLTPDEMDARIMNGGLEHGSTYREVPPARGHSLGDTIRERKAARYEANRQFRGRAHAE